ncbi:Methionine--tRNA ligase [Planctomycetaceae bacterium]|nr:Methionine--tRNA ligase [Planctomycetaceae bacterium]
MAQGEATTPDTPPSPAPAPVPPPEPAEIGIEDFAKVVLKTGRVTAAQPHPNADKLLVLTVMVGSETRTICAGIRQFVKPEDLVDKDIVIVANLKPRKMRGIDSQGMLLAVSDGADVVPLTAMKRVSSGLRVS